MTLFARARPDTNPEPMPDRRSAQRIRVNCLATLVMPSGDRPGRLFDISAKGARLATDIPPAPGCAGLLDWSVHEAFCRVSWSKPGMCGLEFDEPLSPRALEATLAAAQEPDRPAGGTVQLFC